MTIRFSIYVPGLYLVKKSPMFIIQIMSYAIEFIKDEINKLMSIKEISAKSYSIDAITNELNLNHIYANKLLQNDHIIQLS